MSETTNSKDVHNNSLWILNIPFTIHFIVNPILIILYFPNASYLRINTPLFYLLWLITLFSFTVAFHLVPKWMMNLTICRNHDHPKAWLWHRQFSFDRRSNRSWFIITTATGFLYLLLLSDFPLVWSLTELFLSVIFYLFMFVTYWKTSGMDPRSQKNKESKYLDPYISSESGSPSHYEDNLALVNTLIQKFYSEYNLLVKETNLSYVQWWIAEPMRFEVTSEFLNQSKQNIKRTMYQQLSNIPFILKRKWNYAYAIITAFSLFVGILMSFSQSVTRLVITSSPLIYYFEWKYTIFLLLKYLLIVIFPIALHRIPSYFKLLNAEEYMFKNLGEEDWKDYRKEIIAMMDRDWSIFTKWFVPSPTIPMLIRHIAKKYNIDLNSG